MESKQTHSLFLSVFSVTTRQFTHGVRSVTCAIISACNRLSSVALSQSITPVIFFCTHMTGMMFGVCVDVTFTTELTRPSNTAGCNYQVLLCPYVLHIH